MATAPNPTAHELRAALWPDATAPPTRLLSCRHCGQRNRVQVPAAVVDPERHRCGRCCENLFLTADEPFVHLSPEIYQHSLDRRWIAALRSIPGLPDAVRWLLERVSDRTSQLLFMSEAILCDASQFPELVGLVERARLRLDMPTRPAVYLGESPYMNALTTGVGAPVIVVRSALLDQMSDAELLAVLGHELGHLQADHPLYQSLARTLVATGPVMIAPLRVLGWPAQQALLRWARHAELTADRAALLASRDLYACLAMMLILAGGNRPGIAERTRIRIGPFVTQCRELRRIEVCGGIDRFLGEYMSINRTHPHVARRVMQLIQWVEHGNYLNILAGDYVRDRTTARPAQLPAQSTEFDSRLSKGVADAT